MSDESSEDTDPPQLTYGRNAKGNFEGETRSNATLDVYARMIPDGDRD